LFKDSYLLLVGTGPLESETRRLAKDLQIGDRVIFSGQQNDLQSYLSAMDVFCFPSHFEGFGISLLESQTNGLRALVSDVVNDEICLTQAVTKLSLNASANKWASVLVTLNRMGRYDSFDQIKELQDSGYDMQTQWKRLIELYGLAL
jgi:glycosyltransferase involved in cell wall biosynthesis